MIPYLWNGDKREYCNSCGSNVIEVALFNDTFVRLTAAFDPVLDFSVAAGKLAQYLVSAACRIPKWKAPVQADALPHFETRLRGHLQLRDRIHVDTRDTPIRPPRLGEMCPTSGVCSRRNRGVLDTDISLRCRRERNRSLRHRRLVKP